MSDQSPPTLKEIWRLFKETAAGFKEIKARFKDTDAKFKETDAKFKESAAEFKETRRLISANAEHLGRLSKKWGDLGEAMTIGETLPLFNTIDGIEVHSLHPNTRSQHKGKEWEIDAIAIGKRTVIVIEAKTTLKHGHVKTFINTTLKHFTELEPDHIGKQIYGAVGFLIAHSAATELALASGLLLIHPNRDDKKVITPPPDLKLRNFHP